MSSKIDASKRLEILAVSNGFLFRPFTGLGNEAYGTTEKSAVFRELNHEAMSWLNAYFYREGEGKDVDAGRISMEEVTDRLSGKLREGKPIYEL